MFKIERKAAQINIKELARTAGVLQAKEEMYFSSSDGHSSAAGKGLLPHMDRRSPQRRTQNHVYSAAPQRAAHSSVLLRSRTRDMTDSGSFLERLNKYGTILS